LKQLRGAIAPGIQPDSCPETKLEARNVASVYEMATMAIDGLKSGSNPHEREVAYGEKCRRWIRADKSAGIR